MQVPSRSAGSSASVSRLATALTLSAAEQFLNDVAASDADRVIDLTPEQLGFTAWQLRSGVPEIESHAPAAGPFYWVRVTEALERMISTGALRTGAASLDLARLRLRESAVAVAPGELFGVRDHLRLNFSLDWQQFQEAIARVRSVLRG